jgi:hypothetical protein
MNRCVELMATDAGARDGTLETVSCAAAGKAATRLQASMSGRLFT